MNAETIINETVKIIVPTGSPVCTDPALCLTALVFCDEAPTESGVAALPFEGSVPSLTIAAGSSVLSSVAAFLRMPLTDIVKLKT